MVDTCRKEKMPSVMNKSDNLIRRTAVTALFIEWTEMSQKYKFFVQNFPHTGNYGKINNKPSMVLKL